MRHRIVLVCSFLLLGGCVTAEGTAKTRAANDFSCSEDQVQVTNVGGKSYRANGCGKSAVYDCAASDAYKGSTTSYTCVPEGAPTGAAAPSPPPVASSTPATQ